MVQNVNRCRSTLAPLGSASAIGLRPTARGQVACDLCGGYTGLFRLCPHRCHLGQTAGISIRIISANIAFDLKAENQRSGREFQISRQICK